MATFVPHLQHPIINPFPGIRTLEQQLGHAVPTRIGSNESPPYPAHPVAQLNLADCAPYYPDPYARDLRQQLAERWGTNADCIAVDAGADALLLLFLRLFCQVGDAVVLTAGSYPTFPYFARGCGVSLFECPYHPKTLQHDLTALAAAAEQHQAKLVYVANPDNPTGSVYSFAEIAAFRARLPAETFLLLDEAYIDFYQDSEQGTILPNTARVRTFSKAYALAGMRVAYVLAEPEVIAKADQIRIQFAVSHPAQLAALAALADPAWSRGLVAHSIALRDQLAQALQQLDYCVLPSATNFVCVVLPQIEQAQAIQRRLWQDGIAIHRPPHPASAHLLRISAHPAALTPAFLSVFAAAQRGAL